MIADFGRILEDAWLTKQAAMIIASRHGSVDWQREMEELKNSPELQAQAKEAFAQPIQNLEDLTLGIELAIHEQENPSKGKPN